MKAIEVRETKAGERERVGGRRNSLGRKIDENEIDWGWYQSGKRRRISGQEFDIEGKALEITIWPKVWVERIKEENGWWNRQVFRLNEKGRENEAIAVSSNQRCPVLIESDTRGFLEESGSEFSRSRDSRFKEWA